LAIFLGTQRAGDFFTETKLTRVEFGAWALVLKGESWNDIFLFHSPDENELRSDS
jgi:hypothetical protein